MTQVTQTILLNDPSGRPGNCLQAAVASLLDLPLASVPHFAEDADRLTSVVDFAAEHGYAALYRRPENPIEFGLAFGPSPRDPEQRHAVVIRDQAVDWDPHPSRAGLPRVNSYLAFER